MLQNSLQPEDQGCVIAQSLESIRSQAQEAEFFGPEFRADWKLRTRSESQSCQEQHIIELTVRGKLGLPLCTISQRLVLPKK